jgi:hypothetical protein
MNKIKKPMRKIGKGEEMQEWGKKCKTTIAIKNQRCRKSCAAREVMMP